MKYGEPAGISAESKKAFKSIICLRIHLKTPCVCQATRPGISQMPLCELQFSGALQWNELIGTATKPMKQHKYPTNTFHPREPGCWHSQLPNRSAHVASLTRLPANSRYTLYIPPRGTTGTAPLAAGGSPARPRIQHPRIAGPALGTGLSRRRRSSGSGAGRPRDMRSAGSGPVPTGDPAGGGRRRTGGSRGSPPAPPRPRRACAARRSPQTGGGGGRAPLGSSLLVLAAGFRWRRRRFLTLGEQLPPPPRRAAPSRFGSERRGRPGQRHPPAPRERWRAQPAPLLTRSLASHRRRCRRSAAALPPLLLLVFTDKTIWRPLLLTRKWKSSRRWPSPGIQGCLPPPSLLRVARRRFPFRSANAALPPSLLRAAPPGLPRAALRGSRGGTGRQGRASAREPWEWSGIHFPACRSVRRPMGGSLAPWLHR